MARWMAKEGGEVEDARCRRRRVELRLRSGGGGEAKKQSGASMVEVVEGRGETQEEVAVQGARVDEVGGRETVATTTTKKRRAGGAARRWPPLGVAECRVSAHASLASALAG